MDNKEYLSRAFELDREIRLDNEKIMRMKSALYGRTVNYGNISGVRIHNNHSFEDTVQKVVDYEEELNKRISSLINKRFEIENVINNTPDAVSKELLTRRYLFYQKWEIIAEEMNYDLRYIHKLHTRAVKELAIPSNSFIG